MLYRFAAIGIAGFWLVMMGMLVRLETHPEDTDILTVPVSYAMRLMFQHGQASFLDVRDGDKPVGSVSLHPGVTGSDGRALDFSGTLSVQSPLSGARQRFGFSGALGMTAALEVRSFRVDFTVMEPHGHLSLQGDVAKKILTYQTFAGDRVSTTQRLPMDAAAIMPVVMQSVGLDPNALPPMLPTAGITPPTITARETKLKLHGEQMEVYEVTVREGAATAMDIYMTQLGQIVLVNTNFGYTFSAEEY